MHTPCFCLSRASWPETRYLIVSLNTRTRVLIYLSVGRPRSSSRPPRLGGTDRPPTHTHTHVDVYTVISPAVAYTHTLSLSLSAPLRQRIMDGVSNSTRFSFYHPSVPAIDKPRQRNGRAANTKRSVCSRTAAESAEFAPARLRAEHCRRAAAARTGAPAASTELRSSGDDEPGALGLGTRGIPTQVKRAAARLRRVRGAMRRVCLLDRRARRALRHPTHTVGAGALPKTAPSGATSDV